MATVSTFRPCQYSSEADLAAIASLINACRIADDLDIRTSVKELREEFANPQFDINRNLQLWRDGTGNVVVIAKIWHHPPEPNETQVRGSLYFDIHPQVRGGGLEGTIMDWAKQRLRAIGQDFALPLVLQTGCRDQLTERRELLAQVGFIPERYFFQLKRSLQAPLPEQPIPAGWQIRCVRGKSETEAWVEMFNQSFVDHWNYIPMTIAEYCYYISLSDYDPALDLVIETSTGKLVTFCYSYIDTERNQRLGHQEGHVCFLGTRRGYRRQGLARALLIEGLKRLRSQGMETATIGVDSQNPNGAVALYESVGFVEDFRSTVYQQEVTP
ncbi:acetyltransferase [Leptolyngbya sp. Heron Island J]|uniref:GNAT family N-acetyltransferase n=1 Tax=Leptolyngbya sp. Heron Island J TaxID=1385935 RepID=UPI0003B9A8E9|nr:GNAT family N-acetyltransferase [Leptolyngbya sp. Heron Island J]ESA37025.1 acetyltransferase [Leptolyngbya sp. Heron Island J]